MAFFRLQRSSVNKWCWRKSGEQHFSKFWFIYCCYSLSYANLWHHQFWERKVTLTPPAFSNTLAGGKHSSCRWTCMWLPCEAETSGTSLWVVVELQACLAAASCLICIPIYTMLCTPCLHEEGACSYRWGAAVLDTHSCEQKAAWTGWYPVGDNYPQGTESDQLLMCPTLGQHQLMLEHPKSYSPCACPALQTEVHGHSASHEGLPTPSCVLFVRLFVLFVYLFSDTNYFQVSWTPATQKATQLCYHP